MTLFIEILSVITTIAGLVALRPQPDVAPAAQDPAQPFLTRFVLVNNSVAAMDDVRYSCRIARMTTAGGNIFDDIAVALPRSNVSIHARGKHTLTCENEFQVRGEDIVTAEFQLNVSYRYCMVRWEEQYRFSMMRNSTGTAEWMPTADSR